MNTQYLKANKLEFDPRPQMADIFVEGFAHHFVAFSKDKQRLAKAFAHVFDLQHLYVAIQETEVMAITACTGGASPIKFNKTICRKELGFLRGSAAYIMLTKYIVNHKFPFEFTPGMGRIEVVATAPAAREKGIAHGLLKHIFDATPYAEYVLEVVDDNIGAIKLYEKLGFETFKKVKTVINSKANAFLYMKCTS